MGTVKQMGWQRERNKRNVFKKMRSVGRRRGFN
jgi:hypothetical protein